MQRSSADLAQGEFDVLVIGGGAAGAAAAREAALRGLRTALIEREDFAAGASAHCFKIVHGGIRYIQHADVKRLRDSCHERAVFLRLAPHLVRPLRFVVPTYGMGKSSKWFLGSGMLLYDALSADRNFGLRDRSRRIRGTRFYGRQETLELFPSIPREGLTGAAAFEDGQMHSPPRLVLAFVAAAHRLGACIANYVEAERLLVRDRRVTGVAARDVLSGERFDIRARVVINAAGPWAEGLLQGISSVVSDSPGTYSRDVCFVIDRRPTAPHALALPGATRDADALFARGARHMFVAPWRNRLLVGVWHSVVPREPDTVAMSRRELANCVAEINACHPDLGLRTSEVERVDFGLVPFGEHAGPGDAELSFGKHSRLIDHRERDGLAGLVTSISVRYTVARLDAVRAVNCAARQLDPNILSYRLAQRFARSSEGTPLPGGEIDDFAAFAAELKRNRPLWVPPGAVDGLAASFGARVHDVLALADADPALRRFVAGTQVSLCEIAYALREEMAQTLSDIVFRRTDLGTAGHPGPAALEEVGAFVQQTLGWSARRLSEERAAVERQFARYLAAREPLRRIA